MSDEFVRRENVEKGPGKRPGPSCPFDRPRQLQSRYIDIDIEALRCCSLPDMAISDRFRGERSLVVVVGSTSWRRRRNVDL